MSRGITALSVLFLVSSFSFAQDSVRTALLNKIYIQGNEETKASVILRELPFAPGDSVTNREIEYARDRVYSTRLFTKVLMEPVPVRANEIDLLIYVEERWYIWPYPVVGIRDRDWKRFYAGAGIADMNFRGLDEKLAGMFALGYDPFAAVRFRSPGIGSHRDYLLTMSGSYSKGRSIGVQAGSASGEFKGTFGDISVEIGRRFGLFSTISLGASYNYVSSGDDSLRLVLSPNGTDVFAAAKLSYVYDSRNLRSYATDGTFISIRLEKYGLGESLVNFGRLSADARKYFQIGGALTLAARLYGNFAEGPAIPVYDDVFIGYFERIRGMFNSVSQGVDMAGGNLEIRIPIVRQMYIEIPDFPLKEFISNRIGLYWNFFADAGETAGREFDFDKRNLLFGYGGGVSLLLPYDLILQADCARGSDGHVEFILDFGATI